jgi:hypothetical protein
MAQLARENLLVPKGRLVYVKLSSAQGGEAAEVAGPQGASK